MATAMGLGHESFASRLERTERIWEAALKRLDQKVQSIETAQGRLDRRVSEQGGTVRGLAAEMQLQIRRTDAVDGRMSEFRSQLQSELRQKVSEVDSQRLDMLSRGRIGEDATQNKLAQGLRQLQDVVSSRLQPLEVLYGACDEMNERIGVVEGLCQVGPQAPRRSILEELSAPRSQSPPPMSMSPFRADDAIHSDARIGECERQLLGVSEKLDQILAEAHGDHGWESRLHEHAMRLGHIRSKLEGTAAVMEHAAMVGSPVGSAAFARSAEAAAPRPPTLSPAAASAQLSEDDQAMALLQEDVPQRISQLVEQLQSVAPQLVQQQSDVEGLKQNVQFLEGGLQELDARAETCTAALRNAIEERLAGLERQLDGLSNCLPQERIDQMMRVIEENGPSCATIQQQLQEKITIMDGLIQKATQANGGVQGVPLAGRPEVQTIFKRIAEQENQGKTLMQQLEERRRARDDLQRAADARAGGARGGPAKQASEADLRARESLTAKVRALDDECRQLEEQLGTWLTDMNGLWRQLSTRFEGVAAVEGQYPSQSR